MCICITFASCAGDKAALNLDYSIWFNCVCPCVCECAQWIYTLDVCLNACNLESVLDVLACLPIASRARENSALRLTAMLLMWPHESTSPFKRYNKSSRPGLAHNTCLDTRTLTHPLLGITQYIKLKKYENTIISAALTLPGSRMDR